MARQSQLQQAVETLRFQTGLLTQFFGFLIAVDALLVGYALAQRQAVFYLLAISAPLVALAASWVALNYAVPIVYVAVRLERQLLPAEDTMVATYVRTKFPIVFQRIVAALEATDPLQRDHIIGRRLRFSDVGTIVLTLVFVDILVHMVLFLLALTVFRHRLM